MKPVLFAFVLSACAAADAPPSADRNATAEGKADGVQSGSCSADRCGGQSAGNCYCDDECASFHDCCADAAPACGVESNRLEDRTAGVPELASDALEVVASLPYPPGNVTATAGGRTFISFFPDGNKGDFKIAELVGGTAVAFPADRAIQDRLTAVLGLRADAQGRLWLLDHGQIGLHTPKLVAIDIATQQVAREISLGPVAGLGSLVNDLAISPDGNVIYISDLSPLAKRPAIIVVDLRGPTPVLRRRLENHASVVNGRYDTFVDGREMKVKGIRPTQGVDGLTLAGDSLYYAPLNDGELYRVSASALLAGDPPVEHVAAITMTDGMIADAAGRIYLTDMEHYAVTRVDPATGQLEVIARDRRLRWPDGFAWAPDGSLLVTASALHTFLPKLIVTRAAIEQNAPYHVFRIPASRL